MKSIGVLLCCNDQQGSFEGCGRRINICGLFIDSILDLDAISLDRPPRISFVDFDGVKRLLRISGRAFPLRAYTHCTLSLAQDHMAMDSAVVAELLNFLKAKGTFEPNSGHSDAFETWRTEGVRFSAQGLEALTETSAHKNVLNVSGAKCSDDTRRVAQNDLGRVSGAQEAS